MSQTVLFTLQQQQALFLPEEARFDKHIQAVNVRVVGNERILSPVGHSWDSFFLSDETVSDDFMNERAILPHSDRESLS